MPEEGVEKFQHQDILSFEEINRVIKITRELGISKFRFTGGEPFLRKGALEFFEEIIIRNFYITTNLAIDGLAVERINRLKLGGLNVSCDSLKPARYRRITRCGDLNVFIENLKRVKIDNLKINVVVIKDFNEDEIVDFIRFGVAHRATVRFIEKMDFNPDGLKFSSLKVIKQRLIGDQIIGPENYRIHNSVSEYHPLIGEQGNVGFITPITNHFCARCGKIRLKANGELKLCIFGRDRYNLRDILRTEPDNDRVKSWLTGIIRYKPAKPIIKKADETMVEIGG